MASVAVNPIPTVLRLISRQNAPTPMLQPSPLPDLAFPFIDSLVFA